MWFAFQNDGHIYELNGLAEKQLAATFAHGYPTMDEACHHRNKPANGLQASLLALFNAGAVSPVGSGTGGILSIVQVDNNCNQTGSVGPFSNQVTQGLSDTLLGPLKNQNLWIRLAEFAVGAMIFYIGMKGVVSPQNANVAGQTLKQTARYAGRRAKGLPVTTTRASGAVKKARVRSGL